MGLGGLQAVLPDVLPGGRPFAGDNLLKRAARFVLLLSENLVAIQDRDHLDDLELPAFLWPKVDPAIPDQPGAARPVVLSALPEPSRISSRERGRDGIDYANGRGNDAGGNRAR